MHRYLEKFALARAKKIASQDQSYIGLVPVLVIFHSDSSQRLSSLTVE